MHLWKINTPEDNSEHPSKRKKPWKIYQEEAKLRQTTHWDLDYMTTAEIEALMNPPEPEQQSSAKTPTGSRLFRNLGWASAALLVVAIGVLSL